MDTWKKMHPDWEYRLWESFPSKDGATEWSGFLEAAYFYAEQYAVKADILRLEVILRYGGVYVDTDIECHKPIDGLLEGCKAFCVAEYDPRRYKMSGPSGITNGIFGATAMHPAIIELVSSMPSSVSMMPASPLDVGPRLFRSVLHTRSDVRLLEQETFQYLLPHEVVAYGIKTPSPDAYGTHWFELSWARTEE